MSRPVIDTEVKTELPGATSGADAVEAARIALHDGATEFALAVSARREPVSKRVCDVCLSAVGLLLSAPLWVLLAAAIKLEDGGPVFFSHERVGKGGELFRSWKFRSMVPDESGDRLPQQDEPDDGEITRVGKLMRKSALDELPQLWNILKGDMSLVGPRALPPVETTADGETVRLTELPGIERRQTVRPGLTGLAQVRAPRHASHRQKFRYDLLYVQKRSLWLDLKLIAFSLWISVSGAWKKVGKN